MLGDGGAFDHRLQGSRRGYAHFPERTIETQRDSVVLEATYLRSCSWAAYRPGGDRAGYGRPWPLAMGSGLGRGTTGWGSLEGVAGGLLGGGSVEFHLLFSFLLSHPINHEGLDSPLSVPTA